MMLEKEGLTLDKMHQDAAQLRSSIQIGKVPIEGTRGIYYFASDPQKYREAPINVVITKDRLLNIAQRRYIVTKDEITVN